MRTKKPKIMKLLKTLRQPRRALFVGMTTGLVLIIGVFVVRTQQAMTVKLADQRSVQVAGPLNIEFSQEVAPGLKPVIEPTVAGTWKQSRSVLGVSNIWFEPVKRFEAGHTYTVRLMNMKRVLTGATLPDIVQKFTAQSASTIKSTSPAANAKDVSIKPQLTIKLTAANRGLRSLRASLIPAVPLRQVKNDDQTFVWEPVTPLKQGTAYTFVLEDARMSTPEERSLTEVPFTTVTQPGIVSARTGGFLSPGQTIDITFDQAMKPGTDAFQFDVGGKGSWTDDHTYRYTPEGLKPGTIYNYKVKAGITSKVGGVLEAERPFQVASNGAVGASLGTGGTVGINSSVRVSFDQAVDHASAEAHFGISPAVGGKFSWSGNSMTFTPAGLEYQTTYNYGVSAGITPSWGLPGTAASRSFATETQVIKLNVPVYKQAYGRSCELASLRMLLAYRGINVSDWDILMRVGYNPRPRDTASNTWDNPNTMFVGRVDTYSWTEGYGVHAGPIAAAARSYGRTATSSNNVSASFIAASIHAGNPVEFWGHISPASPDSWNTSSGVVQTTNSMHARVVYGVVGRPDAPVGFHIIDPWTATKMYWTTAQLMSNMNGAPPASNQAVVVF
jgi:uncharacterized protein YvpB